MKIEKVSQPAVIEKVYNIQISRKELDVILSAVGKIDLYELDDATDINDSDQTETIRDYIVDELNKLWKAE